MKKIVNNLLYDTDTSTLIHTDEVNNRRLYKTPNGNYFMLFATGEISPKTEDSVKDYLGRNNVKSYIKLFGEPQEA